MSIKVRHGGYSINALDVYNYKLFCDLDGVLTDIEASFRNLHPRYNKIPRKTLWDLVGTRGSAFWACLAWLDDGKKLWAHIRHCNPRILSAAPTRSDRIYTDSQKGKLLWIQRELGESFKRSAIICRRSEKSDHAAARHILIDDYRPNIESWEAAGGIGILHVTCRQTIENLSRIYGSTGQMNFDQLCQPAAG